MAELFAFLAIVVSGYLVVKALSRITDAVLARMGFDEAVARSGVTKALESSRFGASDIVSTAIFCGLFLLVLQAAFDVFGENAVSDLITSVIAFLPKVLAALAIIVAVAAGAAVAKTRMATFLGTRADGS